MKTKKIWLSFDLGIGGDYERLYAWLADHSARECGDGLAVLDYAYGTDLVTQLRKEISDAVKITSRSRMYIICKSGDDQHVKGTWLFGKRRQAPWTGYGSLRESVDDVG